jgi:hypothetical protein
MRWITSLTPPACPLLPFGPQRSCSPALSSEAFSDAYKSKVIVQSVIPSALVTGTRRGMSFKEDVGSSVCRETRSLWSSLSESQLNKVELDLQSSRQYWNGKTDLLLLVGISHSTKLLTRGTAFFESNIDRVDHLFGATEACKLYIGKNY